MKAKKTTKESLHYYVCGILAGIIAVLSIYSVYSLSIISQTSSSLPPVFSYSLFTPQKQVQIPILMYHYVEFVKDPGDTIRQSLNIIPPIFEAQVATLKNNGYTFITPKDINPILEGKLRVKKPVILSFDDGYEDFYTDVMPILKKYNVRAVQYIITGSIDSPNYLTSYQIEDIKRSGLVELACHSVTHPAMGRITEEFAKDEIEGCTKDLMEEFGVKPVSFAYPYGSHDAFLYPMLAEAGFSNSVTTESGTHISRDNIYNIPRLRGGIRIGSELTSYLEHEIQIAKSSQVVQNASAQTSAE